jgi:hypothetical protein
MKNDEQNCKKQINKTFIKTTKSSSITTNCFELVENLFNLLMRFVVTQSKVIFQCKKEMCEHYQCTFSA